MFYSLLIFFLRLVGKEYQPNKEVPAGLIVHIFLQRAVMIVRGVVRFRKKIFVGKRVRLRGKKFVRLGVFCTIEDGVNIDGYGRRGVVLGARTKLGAGTIVSCTSHMSFFGEGLAIGNDCGIGEYGYLGCGGGIDIGDNVIMGQYVSFHSQNHNFTDIDQNIREQGVVSEGIVIKDNTWIGAKVTFLDGVVVGEGSVVAAGAVVKGAFPPYSVIGGVPARVLKSLK